MQRVYNFAAGPSAMPQAVLEKAASEMLCYGNSGMSVMEMSHRSGMYLEIFDHTQALFRKLMQIGPEYEVLFLQGGATAEFAAIPMNLMGEKGKADYVDSGNFAHGALVEARKYGTVNVVASSREENYTRIPQIDPAACDPDAAYFYITTNNTIYGTRYPALPETGDVPLVADMSSNILSEVYDIRRFGVAYAGAQKNIGPAGLTVVIVRKDLQGGILIEEIRMEIIPQGFRAGGGKDGPYPGLQAVGEHDINIGRIHAHIKGAHHNGDHQGNDQQSGGPEPHESSNVFHIKQNS